MEDIYMCRSEKRRHQVRQKPNLYGLDYAELNKKRNKIRVYFLGKAPAIDQSLETFRKRLSVSSANSGTIKIKKIKVQRERDPDIDDCMVVTLKPKLPTGTQPYTLRVKPPQQTKENNNDKSNEQRTSTREEAEPPLFDVLYDSVTFYSNINEEAKRDCQTDELCPTTQLDEPNINYLAKDYASFRQLILDRLALVMPEWQERHAADMGIALVELLAYVGDYLSYYQDAVATEAYLATARQRISVRRHARLVDYPMHEGCNARTWIHIETRWDMPLPSDTWFVAASVPLFPEKERMLCKADFNLDNIPRRSYLVYEPVPLPPAQKKPKEENSPETDCQPEPEQTQAMVAPETEGVTLWESQNEFHFYTWGNDECCLPIGSTSAYLIWKADHHLQQGNVLLFEEVKGPKTNEEADKDFAHRHVVRLNKVREITDTLTGEDLLHIMWDQADALPFPLCISALGPAPECQLIENISVARGNMILVDHGRTIDKPEALGMVAERTRQEYCHRVGYPAETVILPKKFRPVLEERQLTFHTPYPDETTPADNILYQDPRDAFPDIKLTSIPPAFGLDFPLFQVSVLYDDKATKSLATVLNTIARLSAKSSIDKGAVEKLLDQIPELFSPETRQRIRQHLETNNQMSAALEQLLGDGRKAVYLFIYQHLSVDTRTLLAQTDDSPELIRRLRSDLVSMLCQTWRPRRDLLDSDSDDAHFVAEMDNNRDAHIRFGDNRLGQMPAAYTTFIANYRVGNGTVGNVAAEAIQHIVLSNRLSISRDTLKARNPLPAQGGIDPESIETVKQLAPHRFHYARERAIIGADYEEIILRDFAQHVQKAKAEIAADGQVTIHIDARGETAVSDYTRKQIKNHLEKYRRIGHKLGDPQNAQSVSLNIAMTVQVKPNYVDSHVKSDLLDHFSNRLLFNGQRGLFHPDNWSFGQGIVLSQLYAMAQSVDGIVFVKKLEVSRVDGQAELNGLAANEIVRLDNDPDHPENGILTIQTEGGR